MLQILLTALNLYWTQNIPKETNCIKYKWGLFGVQTMVASAAILLEKDPIASSLLHKTTI